MRTATVQHEAPKKTLLFIKFDSPLFSCNNMNIARLINQKLYTEFVVLCCNRVCTVPTGSYDYAYATHAHFYSFH